MTSDERDERQQRLYDEHTENCIRFADRREERVKALREAVGAISDHAHGNKPAIHSHIGNPAMRLGHTMADHERAGDLGSPAYRSTVTDGEPIDG